MYLRRSLSCALAMSLLIAGVPAPGSEQGSASVAIASIYDGPGEISGIVTDEFGAPIAGAIIEAERTTDFHYDYGSALSDAGGSYAITNLVPGNYRIQANALGFQRGWFGGSAVPPGQPVFVSRMSTTRDVNLHLDSASGIAGQVTDGNGVVAAYVRAEGTNGFDFVTTDAQGHYLIEDLLPGNYTVLAIPIYAPAAFEYYDDAYDPGAATLVPVGTGIITSSINITLLPGGALAGVIRDPNGAPKQFASVQAEALGLPFASAMTTSDANGGYVIAGLAPGNYTVMAQLEGYAHTWYGGAFDKNDATPASVAMGVTTTDVDIQFGNRGTISGIVSSVPAFGADIAAESLGCCSSSASTSIGNDGPYLLSGLQPTCHEVLAESILGAQWYDDAWQPEAATPVCVPAGGTVSGINFVLTTRDPNFFNQLSMFAELPANDSRSTLGATLEPSETQPCGNIGATIWYRFALHPETLPGTQVEVDSAGSGFDTVVAVYSGDHISSPPGGIAPVTCNDDAGGPQARAVFSGTPGTTYYVQLGGKSGATGNVQLHVECIGDDDCDGDANVSDTCDVLYNPDQADLDGDGIGDACETDTDGDGELDSDELSFGTEQRVADTDGDGCAEGEEQQVGGAIFGGDRDPLNFWDFYDVTGDSAIDLADALAILGKFGLVPGQPGYDRAYDRYVPDALKPYRTAQASGQSVGIDLQDALINLQSFGHSCAAPP